MKELRFNLTFYGGKADEEHRVPANRLAHVLKSMGDDLVSVCNLISAKDPNIDIHQIERACKLYVVAAPLPSTFTLPIAASEGTPWVERAGEAWISGLSQLPVFGEVLPDSNLPVGINRAVLEHAVDYSTPFQGEYEGIKLTVPGNGRPDTGIVFNERLKTAAARRLAALPKESPITIEGHTIQGILYGIKDENYNDPTSEIRVEVDVGEGTRWICQIRKDLIPGGIERYWEKRVVLVGLATFRSRSHILDVRRLTVLETKSDIDDVIERFIKVGAPAWKRGPKLGAYMKQVRER
jgi:hypothetical protein